MPLYSYFCKKCGKYFEVLIPLDKSDKEIYCKYCKKPLKKIITAPMFKVN